MSGHRLLLGSGDTLEDVYRPPAGPWLRVNFVSSLDGAVAGGDGLSKSLSNAGDRQVFDLLRAQADVLVVGAGTLRSEEYAVPSLPMVVVTRSGEVPPSLRAAPPGRILMATCAASPGLTQARALLGEEQVLVLGEYRVDLAALRSTLVERGYTSILSEGGPRLLRDLVEQGVADELCLTLVPRLVAGGQGRITLGAPVDVPLSLTTLVEIDGTLLGRWSVLGAASAAG